MASKRFINHPSLLQYFPSLTRIIHSFNIIAIVQFTVKILKKYTVFVLYMVLVRALQFERDTIDKKIQIKYVHI